MVNGFKVITLCGSTRFKEEFLEVQKRLTLEGNIVISVGLFGHSGDDVVWTEGVKDMLDRHLEEFKKASIYDNSIAIEELHDSGKLSDEDWEKASSDLAEKREALIAEYNACQGPWPYQWKKIDVVVCGILQRFGFVSCDFYDLKYLYEADRIYEIRIKGKGTNKEEQVQSIIDTIRNDYWDLLQTSEKLAVTILDSDRAAYFSKIADCLSGMDVLWHEWGATAEEKEIRISIVFI